MFWKNKDKAQEAISKAIKDVATLHANSFGASRRATSMVPVAASGSSHEIAHTSGVRFHQLLVSLEGNQRTGCLRIVSPRRKARSAILIYRGRVVGCLYGCKKLDYQYLQQDAHRFALADLAAPGNILDAYELPEELVLAAASLFNGDTIELETQSGSQRAFDDAVGKLADMKLPGCVVVSTVDDEMLAMVYMYEGKLIGAFSAKDGWIKPTFDVAMQYLRASKQTKVMCSYMPVTEKEENIGFSLTGLADASKRAAIATKQLAAVDSFTTIRSEGRTYTNMQPAHQRHQPVYAKARPAAREDYIGRIFSVAP